MKVPKIKGWNEASPYLDMLAQTIINDICPLLNTRGGAPFSVSRQVFSYVDYLGTLYLGTSKTKTGCAVLAQVGTRFRRYLEDVMALTDTAYRRQAHVIYHMYRNGPVHEFDPKELKNESELTLSWLAYPGQRADTIREWDMPVRHLHPSQYPKQKDLYYLPVSTICLVQDLLNSIEYFKGGLEEPCRLIKPWNEAAELLNEPTKYNFTI